MEPAIITCRLKTIKMWNSFNKLCIASRRRKSQMYFFKRWFPF